MSAKEMFEKLGYEQRFDCMGLYYYKFSPATDSKNLSGRDWENKIRFYDRYVYSDKYISIQLLQAINKQVEELGWLGSDDNE